VGPCFKLPSLLLEPVVKSLEQCANAWEARKGLEAMAQGIVTMGQPQSNKVLRLLLSLLICRMVANYLCRHTTTPSLVLQPFVAFLSLAKANGGLVSLRVTIARCRNLPVLPGGAFTVPAEEGEFVFSHGGNVH